MDPTGADLKQLTENEHGARRPSFSSTGHYAWQVLHARRGKFEPIDVMVRIDGEEEEKKLIEKAMLPAHLWHPDGELLVVGCVGSIQFIDVENNERKTVSFPIVDSRLHAHGARSIQWSPDGQQIACRIGFVGGRMGDVKIFGDEEIFLIGQDGECKIFDNLESARESHDWITIK